ncbi:hypothetical protein D1872_287040 [compost metagenome]
MFSTTNVMLPTNAELILERLPPLSAIPPRISATITSISRPIPVFSLMTADRDKERIDAQPTKMPARR